MLQQMYRKETSVILLVIEFFNIAVTLSFLLLFARRFCQLRPYSHTLRYQNYFPKLRILFVVSYILLSVALLAYNLATGSYQPQNWYQYLLQGGGGECINSIILLVQLGVLRFELNKEQPYTKYHLMLFVYLLILESTRLLFTLLDVLADQNDQANLIISAVITTDALVQLVYWLVKRQSLPEFVSLSQLQIDDLTCHTRLIQNRSGRTEKSILGRDLGDFGYLVPNVGYQNGKIKIILEQVGGSKKSFGNRTTRSGERLRGQEDMDRFNSFLSYKNQDCLAIGFYTVEQIKGLYLVCGRYPLKHQINFDSHSISEMLQSLKIFLDEVFSLQSCYQSDILHFFDLPSNTIKEYQQKLGRQVEDSTPVDGKMGIVIPRDLNGGYLSVVCYRYLWVGRCCKFYFRAQPKIGMGGQEIAYPYKSYDDFEELYNNLKRVLKTVGKGIELPTLPRRPNHKDQTQPMHLLQPLQSFLRKLSNDEKLMKIQQAQQLILQFLGLNPALKLQPKFQPQFFNKLKIEAKSFFFDIRRYESVIIWQFTLLKGREVLKTIAKEYEEFQDLDIQLKRHLKNHNLSKTISLPSLQKREKKQKMLKMLANYLQQVTHLQGIQKYYTVTSFFDIHGCNKMIENFKSRQKLVDCSASQVSQVRNSQRESEEPHQSLVLSRNQSWERQVGKRVSLISGLSSQILE